MHTRPTAVRFTSPADAPVPQDRKPTTTLHVGRPAAYCPSCGHLVRALERNTKKRNPLVSANQPIITRHTPTGHTVGRDEVECAGTYARARNLFTWHGTFDQWWELTKVDETTNIRELARAAWDMSRGSR